MPRRSSRTPGRCSTTRHAVSCCCARPRPPPKSVRPRREVPIPPRRPERSARTGAAVLAAQPARFGLAAKLFATLLLLGTIGVLITGALGFVQAGDALRASILNQLTAA